MIRKIKIFFGFLVHLPVHPQWFCSLAGKKLQSLIKNEISQGVVVDIGCSRKWPQNLLPHDCQYVGIDYPETSQNWYKTVPDVFADGHQLPFKAKSVDYVLLLDVLEHLSNTDQVLREIYRILKDNGTLIIQTPFIYPIHDAPRDYYRWTIHGLRQLALTHKFIVDQIECGSCPVETAAVTANVAIAKTVFNWIEGKKVIAVFVLLLPFYVLLNNLFNWVVARFSINDGFMSLNYRMIWRK